VKRKRVKWHKKRGQEWEEGERKNQETRGQEADEEKMEKVGERGGEKRNGDAPQGSRVTNEKRVPKKSVRRSDSSATLSHSILSFWIYETDSSALLASQTPHPLNASSRSM